MAFFQLATPNGVLLLKLFQDEVVTDDYLLVSLFLYETLTSASLLLLFGLSSQHQSNFPAECQEKGGLGLHTLGCRTCEERTCRENFRDAESFP